MTNLFDDVNAQIVGDHLANVVDATSRGSFSATMTSCVADNAPNQGSVCTRGGRGGIAQPGASGRSPR